MSGKKLLLINGSPRKNGTSYSFARTIKLLAEHCGNEAEIIHAIDYFDGKEKIEHLKGLITQSDIVAMSSPLYADTLPYHDIWLLEKLADECANELRGKAFFAVGQCGFPDITRIEPLTDACRFFAEDAGMNWLGGLAYGGGPMINGALLEDIGKKGEKITSGFRLALENVFKGEKIGIDAQELITIKIPKIMYWPLVILMNQMIKKQARQNGNVNYTKKVYLE
ncbi:MAG TPA: NAD(P)H-dependent oxidoreductase [Candidatus Nitrosocosmicus sp.]|nr:NAD(P)H-dependent oxidoreductase [Candidatus Nitrosocosmicus sp.]